MEREGPANTPWSPRRATRTGRRATHRRPHSRIAEKYGLRPRLIIRRLLQDRRPGEEPHCKSRWSSHCDIGLSKQRRRFLSTRDRCQQREINQAFENLRQVLPVAVGCGQGDVSASAKMMTLRLALRYIDALTRILQDDPSQDTEEPISGTQASDVQSCPADDPSPTALASEDSAEDTYVLTLARIFEEGDQSSETSSSGGGDGGDQGSSCASDIDDLINCREGFSDLSDHDVETQLEALADLGSENSHLVLAQTSK